MAGELPRRLFARFVSNRDARAVADVLRLETVGGTLMLLAAVAAVIWANVSASSYEAVRTVYLGPLTLEHWAADGLLTIFFFVAGLELKRELTVGSLSRPREALLPIVAALSGMIIPALIYLIINVTLPGGQPRGWAIPMATDIAFALAILAVVGSQLPTSLRAFLLTLAIVDDLGAILIIATVFTDDLRLLWLLAATATAALWWLMQWRRISGWFLYLPLGVACWWFVWQSGVHPTIAGVALGLLTRSSDTDPQAPVDRWEHLWRPISAGFAVPVFALLAAGVSLAPATLAALATDPVALGIAAGLVLGKTIGVFGGSYLTARFTRAELAPDLRWREVAAVSVLGGVGFTVALLISELAFEDSAQLQETGKAAVLLASLLAAVLAALMLRRRSMARSRAGSGRE
ncbi:MAG TPA: Na+/H+ antiporter NhaA [Microlunatus sp.]